MNQEHPNRKGESIVEQKRSGSFRYLATNTAVGLAVFGILRLFSPDSVLATQNTPNTPNQFPNLTQTVNTPNQVLAPQAQEGVTTSASEGNNSSLLNINPNEKILISENYSEYFRIGSDNKVEMTKRYIEFEKLENFLEDAKKFGIKVSYIQSVVQEDVRCPCIVGDVMISIKDNPNLKYKWKDELFYRPGFYVNGSKSINTSMVENNFQGYIKYINRLARKHRIGHQYFDDAKGIAIEYENTP